ncbi:MAG: hypothetical protein DKM50_01535 [Candidatus Margulisiibacteriota bacterium]|nr:MAG: hypothetical protein A2X43_08275 [Candidatus Margulisbacteria bacterium GWD2_39_127]OGI03128.1 MAG: hypothetical protein A2X42_10895 [Candidatus Margulisbacteria bacterium GWF2_38_17]PZM83785.1 MAG: hypothetical protein DKM50_01535 [Candidatus Margulisiibacteriota bacterium]HAR63023.1 hypothetical protein [Candidatus Margulisiibacteriota bacterium]HCY36728.1 hypothetical protein [Candidatus Margulisiibacteriota bacterium]
MKKKAIIIENTFNEGKNYGYILNRYYGVEVNICIDPKNALCAILDFLPDIIFMEIDFYNQISGFEILEAIREIQQLSKTPIVIISRIRDKEIIKKVYAYGITYYFVKPLDKIFFDKKINLILQGID